MLVLPVHQLSAAAIIACTAQNTRLKRKRTTSDVAVRNAFISLTGKELLCKYLIEEVELTLEHNIVPEDTLHFPQGHISRVLREILNAQSEAKNGPNSVATSCSFHTYEGTKD